ncbi:hypothetical protein B0I35DRAFT_431084 [Stachybotrys elegans]|uniref:6-methylsalicylate decarboxylase n=1 Tax=Stachybotrys elegans TaxID=80388 RepID=A0A8K0SYI4_9HYPO|nr:hypothetical protein B0I35DRAFT_431084 [Stachybotrys elegans]
MAPCKIDVHHHIIPPAFAKAWSEDPKQSQGMKLPPWTPEHSLEFMKRHDIGFSIVSLGAPATSIGSGESTTSFCRQMNEYSAELCKQYPDKFGFFATLPSLEDTEGCIGEIRYAVEELGANGVNILTSYGDKYLGHADFQPIWDELNRLKTVVFIHPGIESPIDAITEPGMLPKPIFDWTHETTRAAIHLISTNTLKPRPGVKVILPHGGGTLPYIANRVAQLGSAFKLFADGKTAEEFLEEVRGFYYDVAFAGYEEPLGLLLGFVKPGHLLYGTDYPFGREDMVKQQLDALGKVLEVQSEGVAQSVYRDAAAQLWPGLAKLER